MIYLIGSLRNPKVPQCAKVLRQAGYKVFDDWYSPGSTTDEEWQAYEQDRGRSYSEALSGWHARHVFDFDRYFLNCAHGVVLVMPAGKSAHLELGYIIGQGKPGFILADGEPERYDVMTQFANAGIYYDLESLIGAMRKYKWVPRYEIGFPHLSDAMWLAGLLEGEGTFVCDKTPRERPRIALAMTDEDTVARAAVILGTRVNGPYKRGERRKSVWCCAVTGAKAAEWMRILAPYMGIRRRAKIEDILKLWNPFLHNKWRKKDGERSDEIRRWQASIRPNTARATA